VVAGDDEEEDNAAPLRSATRRKESGNIRGYEARRESGCCLSDNGRIGRVLQNIGSPEYFL